MAGISSVFGFCDGLDSPVPCQRVGGKEKKNTKKEAPNLGGRLPLLTSPLPKVLLVLRFVAS